MSQELNTPSEAHRSLAHEYYLTALNKIPFDDRCEFCETRRWFCMNKSGLRLCKDCFKYWYEKIWQ